MNKQKRPHRQKKADRILHHGVPSAEIECDYAIAPMTRIAEQMDRKWGIDRLCELVSTETATRYGVAIAYLNECIDGKDAAKCADAANNCIRGMEAMDKEATALNRPRVKGAYAEYVLGDFKMALVLDDKEWPAVKDARPDLMMFTVREAAIALKAYAEVVPMGEVKAHFPDAKLAKAPTPATAKFFQDTDIPF